MSCRIGRQDKLLITKQEKPVHIKSNCIQICTEYDLNLQNVSISGVNLQQRHHHLLVHSLKQPFISFISVIVKSTSQQLGNGHGTPPKSPVCRSGICETVLHLTESSTCTSSQVRR